MKAAALAVYLLAATLLSAQSPVTAAQADTSKKSASKDTANWTYNQRSLARSLGDVGRWWSLLKEQDKVAFLDGFQQGMARASMLAHNTCEVVRTQYLKQSSPSLAEGSAVAFTCAQAEQNSLYDKVTVASLDGFYADHANQFIPVWWAMDYLRDKSSDRKTDGQLLDELNHTREIMMK